MEKIKVIHLEKANTLSTFLIKEERWNIVSLKITGFIGRQDFVDILDDMCDSYGMYDEDDNYIPDYEMSCALRHLDMGDAIYVDGDNLPYFGFKSLLETIILPQGIKSTQEETEAGLSDSENLCTLVLPAGLKIVGGFNSCPKLTGLTLPDSLEVIGAHAFCGCKSITSIMIPASVKYIDGSSFAGCNIAAFEVDENNPNYSVIDGVIYTKDLKTLVAFPSAYTDKHFVVPSTTIAIAERAFLFSKIESIDIPNMIKTIADYAFCGCGCLKSVDIPNSIKSIGEGAFKGCVELEHVGLPTELTEIRQNTFVACPKLKELVVPSSVRAIHYSSLIWSSGLERLELKDGLEEIVDDGIMKAAKGSLRSVFLPKTLKKVPGGVFNYSPYIKSFGLDPENPYFTIIDDALCSKNGKKLFSVPNYHRESYVVPEGIEVIGTRAFSYLPKINTIILPLTLRVIENRAFQGDDSLKSIVIPANVEKIETLALWADNLKTVIMECSVPPEMIGDLKGWIYKDVNLFVPRGSLALYKKAHGWKYFIIKEKKEL